jgi:AI-2 transport protein TqsA
VIVALAAAVAWSSSMIGEWLVPNTGKFQSLHLNATNWLKTHGISVTGFIAERLDVGWIIRFVQDVAGRMRSFAGFFLLVVILTLIGLLEGSSRAGCRRSMIVRKGERFCRSRRR